MAGPLPHPTAFLRIRFGGDDMIGPGKAALPDRIAAPGSIAAATRDLGMSYRRAWKPIERLNAMFDTPLVDSSHGVRARAVRC